MRSRHHLRHLQFEVTFVYNGETGILRVILACDVGLKWNFDTEVVQNDLIIDVSLSLISREIKKFLDSNSMSDKSM